MLSGLLPQVKELRWLTGGDADCVWWLDVAGSVNCCSGWFCADRAMLWSGGVTEKEGSGFEFFLGVFIVAVVRDGLMRGTGDGSWILA